MEVVCLQGNPRTERIKVSKEKRSSKRKSCNSPAKRKSFRFKKECIQYGDYSTGNPTGI